MVNAQMAKKLQEAAINPSRVSGSTHAFYRYPARFSPVFVKQAIEAFSEPGGLIADPFVGGGTTAVEARILGRRCVGVDINSLAVFVSKVKTTVLNSSDMDALRKWKRQIKLGKQDSDTEEKWIPYHRNLDDADVAHIKSTIQQLLCSFAELSKQQEDFARCVILRTAQWALDSKKEIPSIDDFFWKLNEVFEEMVGSIADFSRAARSADKKWNAANQKRTILLNRSAVDIDEVPQLSKLDPPSLILTSPPYPGVHVLYHRWQVKGRRETPAPYWIANKLDGNGLSHYTFGDRNEPGLRSYYKNVYQCFRSLSKICDSRTHLVQAVAFSDPREQLPHYIAVMKEAGFREVRSSKLANNTDGRLWRDVPNRKWHANFKGNTNSSREVMLIHRLL